MGNNEENEMLSVVVLEHAETTGRVANTLIRMKIRTYGDLVKVTAGDLLKQKNFGRKSLKDIKELLADHGLSLRKEGE
jgi:DNA-directed RNA polymerase subunit alpha